MSDLLRQGSQWLEQQRRAHCSSPVTYRRGDDSIEVLATVGKTVFRLDDGYGGLIREVSRDYLISSAELIIADEKVLPQKGDQIIEIINGQTVTHEVMAPGGDEPDWKFADPGQLTLRIHTKEIQRT